MDVRRIFDIPGITDVVEERPVTITSTHLEKKASEDPIKYNVDAANSADPPYKEQVAYYKTKYRVIWYCVLIFVIIPLLIRVFSS